MRIQVGVVVTIDPSDATVRAEFEEEDGKISAPLHVIYNGTLKNKKYYMPKVGEHVLCLFTKESEGFVVGSFYSEETPPPVQSEDKHYIEFEDGSNITYDTKNHALNVNIMGSINIQSGLTPTN